MPTTTKALPFGLRPYRGRQFERMHAPGSKIISASRIGALFSRDPTPRSSRYSLFAHLLGKLDQSPEADNDLAIRGLDMQKLAPDWMKRLQPTWRTRMVHAWKAHPFIKGLVASPDGAIWDPERPDPGTLEVKTVSPRTYQDHWLDGPPMHVELQSQTQMLCCGASWGGVLVCINGDWHYKQILFVRDHEQAATRLIEVQVAKDLKLLAAGEMPPPDVHPATFEALRALFPRTDSRDIGVVASTEEEDAETQWRALRQGRLDAAAAKARIAAAIEWFHIRWPTASTIRIRDTMDIHHTTTVVDGKPRHRWRATLAPRHELAAAQFHAHEYGDDDDADQ